MTTNTEETVLKANHVLDSSQKVLDDLIDVLSDWVWEVDSEGRFTYCSSQVADFIGYAPGDVIGKTPFDFMPDDEAERIRFKVNEIFRNRARMQNLENWSVSKDGRKVLLSTSGVPVIDADGNFTGYRGVCKDITESRGTLEQLIHAQKMESIGELAGGLAHDLNNILSVINGYATLAQIELAGVQKKSDNISEIIKASARAGSLVRSLLTYSRKQEMEQRKQSLNILLETVGAFISRVLNDNIQFNVVLADVPLVVNVDTVQIEQALLNLATNARDAMPAGGTLSIACAAGDVDESMLSKLGYGKAGRYAIITVTDTGHGMDEQTRLRVFDPFFTTKEVGKGTGLGLSMVMGIIKQHGGFVDLTSEIGKGSVFRLYLPLVSEKALEPVKPASDGRMEKAHGTVMIMEDDDVTRGMLEELLTRAGYTVVAAVDGQDGVEKFAARREEIQLVVSDVVMPRKSGKQACDEIKEMSGNVKVIFASVHASVVMEGEGELGSDAEIFMKPILPFELLRRIKEMLDQQS